MLYRDQSGAEWMIEEVGRHELGLREGSATVTLRFTRDGEERIARACPLNWPRRMHEAHSWFARSTRRRMASPSLE